MSKPLPSSSARPDLRFDFLKAAQEFLHEHPHLRKKTIVINAQDRTWIGPHRLFQHLIDDDIMYTLMNAAIRGARRDKTSFIDHNTITTIDYRHLPVALAIFHPAKNLFYDPVNRAFDDAATFDHEMTHLLTPEMSGCLSENVADARAVIRHFQRFGTDQNNVGYCGWRRAVEFMQEGDASHLTTFSLDHVYNDRKVGDFERMNTAETLQAAKDYARHTPDDAELQTLTTDFNRVAHKPANEDFFRGVFEITMTAPVASKTFYLGARVLMPALSENGVILNGRRYCTAGVFYIGHDNRGDYWPVV